jgi:hypothetical protein
VSLARGSPHALAGAQEDRDLSVIGKRTGEGEDRRLHPRL